MSVAEPERDRFEFREFTVKKVPQGREQRNSRHPVFA